MQMSILVCPRWRESGGSWLVRWTAEGNRVCGNSHALGQSDGDKEEDEDRLRVGVGGGVVRRHVNRGVRVRERDAREVPVREEPAELYGAQTVISLS